MPYLYYYFNSCRCMSYGDDDVGTIVLNLVRTRNLELGLKEIAQHALELNYFNCY